MSLRAFITSVFSRCNSVSRWRVRNAQDSPVAWPSSTLTTSRKSMTAWVIPRGTDFSERWACSCETGCAPRTFSAVSEETNSASSCRRRVSSTLSGSPEDSSSSSRTSTGRNALPRRASAWRSTSPPKRGTSRSSSTWPTRNSTRPRKTARTRFPIRRGASKGASPPPNP